MSATAADSLVVNLTPADVRQILAIAECTAPFRRGTAGYALNGINLRAREGDPELRAVATDGKMMAVAMLPLETYAPWGVDVTISPEALDILDRRQPATIDITAPPNDIEVRAGAAVVAGPDSQMYGPFPDYRLVFRTLGAETQPPGKLHPKMLSRLEKVIYYGLAKKERDGLEVDIVGSGSGGPVYYIARGLVVAVMPMVGCDDSPAARETIARLAE